MIPALVIVAGFFWWLARECRIAERRAWMTEEAERALRHRAKANASRLRSTGVQ